MKNFMDRFKTPEEYIRYVVLSDHCTQDRDFKKDMALYAALSESGYRELLTYPKDKILDALITTKGTQALRWLGVGVNSLAFQLKFGITNEDVKKLALGDLILKVGREIFYKNGREYHAAVYDVYDYFRLTPEKVHAWLKKYGDDPSSAPRNVNDRPERRIQYPYDP